MKRRCLNYIAFVSAVFISIFLFHSCTPDQLSKAIEAVLGAPPPVFSLEGGRYGSDITVEITCYLDGTVIYYTTDGSDPRHDSAVYESALPITGDGTTLTLKAISAKADMQDSPVTAASYEIAYEGVAKPEYNPPGGMYAEDQNIILSCATEGATIYYDLSASPYDEDTLEPTSEAQVYSGPIPVSGHGTSELIIAYAVKEGLSSSNAAFGDFEIKYRSAAPEMDLAGGTYSDSQTVTINATGGSTIYYTLDGSTPTETNYDGTGTSPVTVEFTEHRVTRTLKAAALTPTYQVSNPVSETYTIIYDELYVNGATGSSSNSGFQPDEALDSIPAAIAKAETETVARINVAVGTYDTATSIDISGDISLYGGYSSDFSSRDTDTYETIINDTRTSGSTPRTLRFLTGTTGNAVFDGFTVNAAAANDHVIAVSVAGAPVIRNCIIRGGSTGNDNRAVSIGGDGGSLLMNNEIICRSSSWTDQGIYADREVYIVNNIVRSTGSSSSRLVTLRSGSGARIYNNLLIGGSTSTISTSYGIHIEGGQNADIRNNIIYDDTPNTSFLGVYESDANQDPDIFQNNNIFSYDTEGSFYLYYNEGSTSLTNIADVNNSSTLSPTLTGGNINIEMVTNGYFVNVGTEPWDLDTDCPVSITEGGQDLSAEFSALGIPPEDRDGIDRGTGTWSIGPYE
jgi:hypothetical protein